MIGVIEHLIEVIAFYRSDQAIYSVVLHDFQIPTMHS